jgi:hypothetical protein
MVNTNGENPQMNVEVLRFSNELLDVLEKNQCCSTFVPEPSQKRDLTFPQLSLEFLLLLD